MNLGSYSIREFSKLVNRIDFAKVHHPNFTPPDLKGIQIDAYGRFIKEELKNLVKSYFPLYSQSKCTCITLEDVIFREPEFSEDESLEKGRSYQYSIYVQLRLVSKQGKNTEQIVEDTVFLGNLPELTSRSNFVINGIEKFIISQIVRAPGTYILNRSQIKLSTSKKKIQEGTICELLALKGSTILINYVKEKDGKYVIRATAKNNIGDSVIQFPITVLLKAFGMSERQILEVCDNADYMVNTLEKEEYNPKSLIFGDSSLYIKWFKANVVPVKAFDQWLEDCKNTVYYTLNKYSHDFYVSYWEKVNDLLGKLETAAADSDASDEYWGIRKKLDKEIDKASDLMEKIVIE